MSVSEAKKRANARWNASKDNLMLRPSKEEGAAIRAAAIAAGQSNQQYILQAVKERMEQAAGGHVTPPAGGDCILPSATLEAAQRAVESTGEDVPAFVARAVETQAKRDKSSLSLSINPATGERIGGKEKAGD